MDIGVISVRYARALLKAALDQKIEDAVYQDMMSVAAAFIEVPHLRQVLANPTLSDQEKQGILVAATGGSCSELTKECFRIILEHGRENMAQFIANSYITLYRKQKNIIRGKLTTAAPVPDAVEQKMRGIISQKTNGIVEFETDINPEIMGGFILEYDTYRMDASVKTKLTNILKQLSK